jgi:hypothetical protein
MYLDLGMSGVTWTLPGLGIKTVDRCFHFLQAGTHILIRFITFALIAKLVLFINMVQTIVLILALAAAVIPVIAPPPPVPPPPFPPPPPNINFDNPEHKEYM